MEKETKTERLQLRLTPMEKRNVAYHAQLMNVSVNEYISLLIRRKRIVICENIPELIYQIQKIGNNIIFILSHIKNLYLSINITILLAGTVIIEVFTRVSFPGALNPVAVEVSTAKCQYFFSVGDGRWKF